MCVCLSVIQCSHDPSWQKDFGAKELSNVGRGRCVNPEVFSLFMDLAKSHEIHIYFIHMDIENVMQF